MRREPFEELCSKHHPMNAWELCNFTYRTARRLKRRTLGLCGTSSTKSLEEMTEILSKMGFLKEAENKNEATREIINNYLAEPIVYKTGSNFMGVKEEKYLVIAQADDGKNYNISSHLNPFFRDLISS